MLALLLVGCPHGGAAALPPSRPARYEVAVAAAVGERAATSVHALELEPLGSRVWSVRTVHTEGAWEDGPDKVTFDSEAPRPEDPWPLTLQHAVAAVPAAVRFSADGTPEALVEPDAWRDDARAAVEGLGLPAQALASGESLLDPDGLLRDLQRTVPGTPDAEWIREETVAGVPARRIETCSGDGAVWTCVGRVEATAAAEAVLHETRSETRVKVDARGLVELESTYVGTLVLVGEGGAYRGDHPIAGRRWVVRR